MIFLNDIQAKSEPVKESIEKYGYAPEHNFWWYACQNEKDSKTVFAESKDGSGLLTIEEIGKKRCEVLSSPVAPDSRRVEVIIEYLNLVFESTEIKKVEFELETELYKNLIKALPDKFKARSINFTLTWPIYNLETFDDSLSGGLWKNLRKVKNKFYQNHSVEILDAKTYEDKEVLHALIDECKRRRKARDRAIFSPYHNFVEDNFEGADEARLFAVNGKVCGINAGWKIKNSDIFYGAIMLHDYSLPGLGETLYLENLIFLKSHGYRQVNMGGGDKDSMEFKDKFHPQSFYKTHYFCIIKN